MKEIKDKDKVTTMWEWKDNLLVFMMQDDEYPLSGYKPDAIEDRTRELLRKEDLLEEYKRSVRTLGKQHMQLQARLSSAQKVLEFYEELSKSKGKAGRWLAENRNWQKEIMGLE